MTPQIPNYEIKRVLGEGGMAVVYLAEHLLLHQEVAIKVLNKEYCYNLNIKKRFLDEGRKLARLQHENIVRVINLIEQEDMVAIVMEKIEGVTLKELLESYGKLELNEIANFLKQMTNALGYVHDQGYVHRDIKPSNFMITNEGKVKLLDFGIAKDMRGNMEYTVTGTNQQMGTLLYMSPEQVNEVKLVDKQTDIYSLGVVLWQLVSGKKPYSGMTLSKHQIEIKIVNEPLSPTNSILDGVISKATAKQTENRYLTCAQLWGDMERIFIKEKIILDNETTVIENRGKKEKEKRPFNWMLLLFVLIIVSCVGFIIWKKAIFFPEEEIQELSSFPTIETVPVFSVFQRDALSGGTISSDGGSEILEKGIVWSTNQNPDISLSTKTNEGGNSSNFNSKISNLLPGTRYYLRAYATNSVGTKYGQEQTFVTEREVMVNLPQLTTRYISSIKQREAMSGGAISFDGGSEILEKGIVWSKNREPNISMSTKTNEGGNSSNYISKLTNLSPNTRYYVRAYATNSSGTEYGQEQTFMTEKEAVVSLPQLTTRYISSITQREAMSGGAISFDGGSAILAKGIVWSKNREPNIFMSTKTNEGGNSSNYISKLTNLTPDTRYYLRAYATNSVGTEYGQEQTFMTEKEAVVFSGSGSIGSQVWQTKNLNVDRFRNGDPIPEAKTKEAWVAAGENRKPAWCYYENNASNGSIYGKIYNCYAATDSRGICPSGWHLPSDKEWTALTNYLGKNVAGGKMKSIGNIYWQATNEGATNESGFFALPGGYRDNNGSFYSIRYEAFFWSATVVGGSSAWSRTLYSGTSFVAATTANKSSGASVRCLRD
jgi:uncharacterized protein (TIGR02145 family)